MCCLSAVSLSKKYYAETMKYKQEGGVSLTFLPARTVLS